MMTSKSQCIVIFTALTIEMKHPSIYPFSISAYPGQGCWDAEDTCQ